MPAETLPQPRHYQQPGSPHGEEDDFGATRSSQSRSIMGGSSSPVGLYATPSYASLYVEPEDLEPGPGSYDSGNVHGHQVLSRYRSMPSLSMTAKHDKSWQKVWISKEHISMLIAKDTPGPGTYKPLPAATQSRVRFGTAKRRGISDNSFRAPGPVYDTETETGEHQKVKVRFSKAQRFSSRDDDQPGPGSYEMGSTFSSRGKSFGASHRAYDKVRFPGNERINMGRLSPGPGVAKPYHNTGQPISFGGAPRMPKNLAALRAPGPGTYDWAERETSVFESSPQFSQGRPNARGRLNLKALKLMSHSASWGVPSDDLAMTR